MKDAVLYIMDNTKDTVGSTQICSQLLDCDVGSKYFEWTIGDLKGKTVDKVEVIVFITLQYTGRV